MGDGYRRSTDGFGIDRDSSAKLIVKTALENGVTNPAQIAYMLATAQHESENFTAPDEHYGRSQARKLKYRGGEEYFGRGYAHLTHVDNYEKFDRLLGLDGKLLASPRLAKNPEIAAKVLVIGMRDGLFTGKRLDRYINEISHDLYNARRTVNGVSAASPWSIKAAKQCQVHAEAWEKKVSTLIEDVRKDGAVLKSATISDSVFQKSERSAVVHKLQQNLNTLNIPDAKGRPLAVDGVYGPSTQHAIAYFQRQHGLHVDGRASQEILTATQFALSVPNPLHDIGEFGERLRQSIQPPGPALALNTGAANSLPDYLRVEQHAPSHASPPIAAARHPQPAPNAVADGVLQKNEHGPIIRILQQNLNTLGVTDNRGRMLKVDGDYGDNTRAAVSKFQEAQGLPATGIADHATLGAVQAHVIVADLQRRKSAREAAQAREAHLRADPALPVRETAALHASLYQSAQEAHIAAQTARPEHTKSPLDLLLERAHRAALDQDDYALGAVVRDFRQSSHGREWTQQQHDYSQTQRLAQEAASARQQPTEIVQPQSRGWSR